MADLTRYAVPRAEHRVEDTIERSRFITTVGRASDVAAARDRIELRIRIAYEHVDAAR